LPAVALPALLIALRMPSIPKVPPPSTRRSVTPSLTRIKRSSEAAGGHERASVVLLAQRRVDASAELLDFTSPSTPMR
jgi:hypothetical protein